MVKVFCSNGGSPAAWCTSSLGVVRYSGRAALRAVRQARSIFLIAPAIRDLREPGGHHHASEAKAMVGSTVALATVRSSRGEAPLRQPPSTRRALAAVCPLRRAVARCSRNESWLSQRTPSHFIAFSGSMVPSHGGFLYGGMRKPSTSGKVYQPGLL